MTLAELKRELNWNVKIQFSKATGTNPKTGEPSLWANGWLDSESYRISAPWDVFQLILQQSPLKEEEQDVDNFSISSKVKKIAKETGMAYTQVIVVTTAKGDAGAA